jgi:hypothetical protein
MTTNPLLNTMADLLLDLGLTEDDLAPLAALSDALVDLDLDEDEEDQRLVRSNSDKSPKGT